MLRRHVLAGAALPLAACSSLVLPGASGELRRVALSSCADQTKPQPLWDTVLARRPGLMLFGGDNVYASAQPWSLAQLEGAYATQAAHPGFARLRREVPHLATWDDHDYGFNDGGAEFAHKAASKAAFLRFWQVPAEDERHGREGVYHARSYGPPGRRVQVIMLDTRWFRSPWRVTDRRGAPGRERFIADFDGSKTILGDAQWQWLGERLREPADVRLIVSSMQVVADGHGWERWGHFPFEMYKLYRLITVSRANGVVFLSGDRHVGAIYRETRAAPYPLYELTSSGVTHPWREAAEAGPNRLGDLFADIHYGEVNIDWARQSLRLSIHDLQGVARRSQEVDLRELQIRV